MSVVRKLRLFASFFLLILLSAPSMFVPVAYASPTLQNFTTAITSAPAGVQGVDVDSKGRVFVTNNAAGVGGFYYSLDGGVTWHQSATNVPYIAKYDGSVWVDSRDYVYLQGRPSYLNSSLWRSVDSGVTFSLVAGTLLGQNPTDFWKMTELSNGTLLANTYATLAAEQIWKSIDSGASWSVWKSWGNSTWNHIHSVRVDPYYSDIYVATGDGYNSLPSALLYLNSDTNSWITIYNSTDSGQPPTTDFFFDADYVYYAPDCSQTLFRTSHRPTNPTLNDRTTITGYTVVISLDTDELSSAGGAAYSMMANVYDDGTYILPTDKNTVLASIDGEKWIKVLETSGSGADAWRFTWLSHRRPIYVVNQKYGLLYRIDASREQLANQIQQEWTTTYAKGTMPNQYSLEQVIVDGKNMLYFNPAMHNARVTFRGFSQKNIQQNNGNSGWELGLTSRWTYTKLFGNPKYAVISSEKHSGTYSLNVTVDGTAGEALDIYNKTIGIARLNVIAGDPIFYGFWYQAKSLTCNYDFAVTLCDATNDAELAAVSLQGTVTNTTVWYGLNQTWSATAAKTVYLRLKMNYGSSMDEAASMFIDDCFLFKKHEQVIRPIANGNTYVARTNDYSLSYTTTESLTTNPSVTLNSQTLTCPGTLANGTESSNSIIIDNLEGIVTFTASIDGSQLALIHIEADSSDSSGTYTVTITVSTNYFPIRGATVSINGENKTTDLFGSTTWTLPYGDYVIWAYYQGKNQSQTVSINQDRTLGFNFTTPPPIPPGPPNFTSLLIIAVVLVVGFILLSARRRK